MLAINRGEKKKELTVRILLPDSVGSQYQRFFWRRFNLERSEPARERLISGAIQDGFKRLGEKNQFFVLPKVKTLLGN